MASDDIYTPPAVFDALELQFDLDVCAPEGGLPWIPAKRHYSLKDDGLAQPWEGLIWCNPPYSKPSPWIDKFINHNNGIMLVQLSRSKAIKQLWNKADGIALQPTGFKFINPQLEPHAIFMVVMFFSMGEVATEALNKSGYGRVR